MGRGREGGEEDREEEREVEGGKAGKTAHTHTTHTHTHTPVSPHVPEQCQAPAAVPALAGGVAVRIALGQCYSSHAHAPAHLTLPAH